MKTKIYWAPVWSGDKDWTILHEQPQTLFDILQNDVKRGISRDDNVFLCPSFSSLVKKILPTEKKIEWLNMQAFLNFKEIEVTSFVPEKIVPQFFDSEEILQAAKSISGLTSSVLVPNFFGAKKAFELQAEKINCVISASESHNKANINKDIKSSITELSEIVSYNKSLENRSKIGVAISTSFGCSIEGEVSNQKVLHLVEKIIEIGVDEITIADTVGYANPKQVKMLFNSLMRLVGNLDIFAHFHDTRGLGMANVLTAFDLGIRKFDSSLLGLGAVSYTHLTLPTKRIV